MGRFDRVMYRHTLYLREELFVDRGEDRLLLALCDVLKQLDSVLLYEKYLEELVLDLGLGLVINEGYISDLYQVSQYLMDCVDGLSSGQDPRDLGYESWFGFVSDQCDELIDLSNVLVRLHGDGEREYFLEIKVKGLVT